MSVTPNSADPRTTRLPTAFAPAERATPDEVLRQHRMLAALPLIPEFLDAMPNMAVVLNADRQIVFTNKPFRSFLSGDDGDKLGAQRQDVVDALIEAVIGKRPGEAVGCIHACETEGGCGTTPFCRHCGAVRAIVNSQKWQNLDVQECRLTVGGPVGRETSVDFRVWAQHIPIEGEPFTVFSLLDISHEKRREVLERIFFHDVMNTAGGVRGLAELMAQDQLPQADIQEAVEIMAQSADQLVEEISAQRALIAAESGDLEVKPRRMRSMEIVRQVLSALRNTGIGHGRKLIVAVDSLAFDFSSDPVLLRRVLVNLVKNALEATTSRDAVTIGAYREPGDVLFTVHNPTVMPPESQLQLFQRSFSTKGAGRGLGTYSIKLLTHYYLGGRVSFVSSLDDGTTFSVRLPMELTPPA
jgi:nitrogen-specific signal transduction histidine kinase